MKVCVLWERVEDEFHFITERECNTGFRHCLANKMCNLYKYFAELNPLEYLYICLLFNVIKIQRIVIENRPLPPSLGDLIKHSLKHHYESNNEHGYIKLIESIHLLALLVDVNCFPHPFIETTLSYLFVNIAPNMWLCVTVPWRNPILNKWLVKTFDLAQLYSAEKMLFWQYICINPDNDVTQKRRHIITWTNDDTAY